MTTPTPAPAVTSREAVKRYLAINDTRDDMAIDAVVSAVCSLVVSWHGEPASGVWPQHHQQGATMLAARVYRRRNSPNGVESFGSEVAGAVYTRSSDPDIAQLLEIGRYARPQVG